MSLSLTLNDGSRVYTAQAPSPYQVASAIQMQMQPDVTFVLLPFYELINVITRSTSLIQNNGMAGFQRSSLYYHLTYDQTQLITDARKYVDSAFQYDVQVHLRFCPLDTSAIQEDLYPCRCKVIVNGKVVPLPGAPGPNVQNQEPRKPHRPINITTFCRALPSQQNEIHIQWAPSLDLNQRFCATIHLVKVVPVNTLIEQLTNKPVRLKDQTLDFIKGKLCPDDTDSEIAMTSLKVSLCCPISRTRMAMPFRGNNCKHLQCFDGTTYIQMNERRPTWVCPVCDQKAYYADLFKDELFMSIISEANCDDIVFSADGSWSPLDDSVQDSSSSKQPEGGRSTPKQTPKSKTPPLVTVKTISDPITISETSNDGLEGNKGGNKEVNFEVINIDDYLDLDMNIPPLQPIQNSCKVDNSNDTIVSTPYAAYSNVSLPPPIMPMSDPQLPGLDFYDIFPAVVDQNGYKSLANSRADTHVTSLYSIPALATTTTNNNNINNNTMPSMGSNVIINLSDDD